MGKVKVETTRRERRIHKEGMDKYVFEPSRDYAMAFGLLGFGFGLAIVGTSLAGTFLAPIIFTFSIMCCFAGTGWAMMIKSRLDAYYYDIMLSRVTDETTTTHRDEERIAPRQIPINGGEDYLELSTQGELSRHQWRDVAYAILVHNLPINQKVFARDSDTKIMSQPQYSWWYNHMQDNKYLNGNNELTVMGREKLQSYLPTPIDDR